MGTIELTVRLVCAPALSGVAKTQFEGSRIGVSLSRVGPPGLGARVQSIHEHVGPLGLGACSRIPDAYAMTTLRSSCVLDDPLRTT